MQDEEESSKDKALHGARIEDYALLADGETAALVSRGGSIDWLCWPTFASDACFAALLGTADHGFWRIAPADEVTGNTRRYRPGTMVVETTFETAEGTVELTDLCRRGRAAWRGWCGACAGRSR